MFFESLNYPFCTGLTFKIYYRSQDVIDGSIFQLQLKKNYTACFRVSCSVLQVLPNESLNYGVGDLMMNQMLQAQIHKVLGCGKV
jgi:hypothetical protein